MMLDIDDFKNYNDKYGYLQGDKLLKQIGNILTDNLRDVDVICRYAGDEFAVILPETKIAGAAIVADKIIHEISRHPFKKKVTASVGLTQAKGKMEGYDLISKAGHALQESKNSGKNKVVIYE